VKDLALETLVEALTLLRDVAETLLPTPPSDLDPGLVSIYAVNPGCSWSDAAWICAAFAATSKKTELAFRRSLTAPT
jgi:hypothetical protein